MEEKKPYQFSLDAFQKVKEKMIKNNSDKINDYLGNWNCRIYNTEYTGEQVEKIINSGSLQEKIKMSRTFYEKGGLYKRIILHYATLLQYCDVLVPNLPSKTEYKEKNLSEYFNALDFINTANLSTIYFNCIKTALRDGCYYGLLQGTKDSCTTIELPNAFCRSQYTSTTGRELLEFNVGYFDTITDSTMKSRTLKAYPKEIVNYYKRYRKNSLDPWYLVPSDLGLCFSFDDGNPFFIEVISASLLYREMIGTEIEKEKEEIRKIIVQKVPHLADGSLLFEPEEAAEIHSGAVGMMKSNANVSVLTSYTDVEAITSTANSASTTSTLDRVQKNVFMEAGASSQIFSADGNLSLGTSLNNDLALVMPFVEKFEKFVTQIVNKLFSTDLLDFTYKILPVSRYNTKEMVEMYLQLATSGYSLLLPSIASGISQRSLVNLKHLENEVLDLTTLLIPLSTSYTQSSKGGAPSLEEEEKTDKTISNEIALEGNGN